MQFLQHSQAEKINTLLEQIVALEKQAAANQEAAEEVPVLKNKLDMVNQSLAHLNKSTEALEENLCSANEKKADLEAALSEKTKLVSALEDHIKNLTEKMLKETESHSAKIEDLINRERILKEQLEGTKNSLAAATAESSSHQEEIQTMNTTLSTALRGLEEKDNSIKSLKEKLNRAEAEHSKASELLKEKSVAMNKIKVGS